MAWEWLVAHVSDYVAKKGLDAMWDRRKIFVQTALRWMAGTIAEKSLLLDEKALLAFYRREDPIEIKLADAYVLPATLLHEPVGDGRLASQTLTFEMEAIPFTVSTTLDAYVKPIRALAQRDKRLALDGDRGVLRPAAYFDAVATNFSMDHKPAGHAESLREFVHKEHRLDLLSNSLLANHIGIVVMVETADGRLVAQCRSGDVANRPFSISASVSGALNWTDIWRGRGEQVGLSALIAGAFREQLEELGSEPQRVRYLGLAREYLRGGKPELYFFARVGVSEAELVALHQKAEGRGESKTLKCFDYHSERVDETDGTRYSFVKRVEKILERTTESANLTFVIGTVLASKHMLRASRKA
jgi:hypothetical protein